MEQQESISEEFLRRLTNAGITTFATQIYRNNNILKMLDDGEIHLAFIPSDAAFQHFLTVGPSKSLEELYTSQLGKNIIANHFSKFYGDNSVVQAINNTQLPLDLNTVKTFYRPTAKINVGPVNGFIISTVIVTPNQLAQWKTIRSEGFKSAFGGGQVGNTGMEVLITRGQVKGKDLIALCGTNFEAADFCNRQDANGKTIFHRLLREEFNLNLNAIENAKGEYLDRYSGGYTYLQRPGGNVTIAGKTFFRYSPNLHVKVFATQSYVYGITSDSRIEAFSRLFTPAGLAIPIEIRGLPPQFKVKKIQVIGITIIMIDYEGNAYATGNINHGWQQDGPHQIFLPHNSPTSKIIDLSRNAILRVYPETGIKSVSKVIEHQMEVPSDVIQIGNSMRLRKGIESCILAYYNGSLGWVNLDLASFPGGSFTCDLKKILFELAVSRISIISDSGKLWIADDLRLWGPQDIRIYPTSWKAIDDFRISRVIDHAAYQLNENDGWIILILDNHGQIATIKKQNDQYIVDLNMKVPGLLALPEWSGSGLGDGEIWRVM